MAENDIKKFYEYKDLFDNFQRYFEASYSVSDSFITSYESVRDEFLKYKPYYENHTKDYRKNSSYITLGNNSYEFITPNEFSILKSKTIISDNEKKIINGSYIGTTFSWELNSKLRKSKSLNKHEELIKRILQNVINKNILEKNYLCKKYTHFDYIKEIFGIDPLKLNDKELENELDKHVGEIKEEKGFMSCSMTDSHVLNGECLLKVYVHGGTKAFVTDNINETEVIINCGTKYVIIKSEVNSGNKNRIILHILIIRIKNV